MFNVPLHRVRQLRRTELAWRVESAQCLRSSHSLTMHPKKQCFFGDPAEARGSPDKRKQALYQRYSKVIRMAGELGGKSPSTRPDGEKGKPE